MMINKSTILMLTIVFSFPLAAVSAETPPHNGKIEKRGGQTLAWDESANRWVSPKVFWQNYAKSRGGLTWEKSRNYPAYEQVKEHDTFMVLVDSGPCLMEFFHSRWRRANDVRRWDPAFNEYGGCPNVFD